MSAELLHANISQVTANLWIGGDLGTRNPDLAHAQLNEIDAAGITDILDVRLERSDEVEVSHLKPHLRYKWLGVDDAGQKMPDEWFDVGTQHALAAFQVGSSVLVHCHMGINRGPSLGFAVLLALGWEPISALDRIREARPIAYIGYAEDALDWWLRARRASDAERRVWQRRILDWRHENHLDVADVIRKVRHEEGAQE